MTELSRRLCACGNPAQGHRPTCGIVICLANDAFERATKRAEQAAAKRKEKVDEQPASH